MGSLERPEITGRNGALDAQALQRRFDLYIEMLRVKYSDLAEPFQADTVNRLEALVGHVLNPRKQINQSLSGDFDKDIARKKREEIGLKQVELAKKIGINPVYVAKYEGGFNRVLRGPKTKHALKYFTWLKEQGYNPFNL